LHYYNPGSPQLRRVTAREIFSLVKRTNVPYLIGMEMTKRQREILEHIGKFQAREGFPPSIREICTALEVRSPGSMHRHLRELKRKGYLEETSGKKRAWKLADKGGRLIGRPSSPSIPLIGRIAAGTPILAQENRDEELSMDPGLFGSEEAFALRIQGDSMKDAQIRDGDLAIIRPQREAETGEIVAVMVEGVEAEATLKILHRSAGRVELHAANEAYTPLMFRGKDRSKVKILGKLIGIIRLKP
jgi:repressor LexA